MLARKTYWKELVQGQLSFRRHDAPNVTLETAEKWTVNFTVHYLAARNLSYPVNALRSPMSHSLTEILRIPSLGKFALESTFKK